jgi:hypothetical protein
MAGRPRFRELIDKKDLGYFLAFLILFVLLFQGFILADRTLFVRDISRLEIPSRWLCAQLLKEGDFALWTDAFGNGQPFLANPKNAVFYPTTWLFLILPFFLAFKLHYVIHIMAAYLGIYYLGKSYGFSRTASFLAASLFLASGPYLSSIEFYNHIAALAWLPWALLCQRIFYRQTALRIIVPSVIWTLAVIAGAPEIVVIAILLVLFQTFFLSENWRREVPLVLLPLVLAALISSVQVLPTLEHLNGSARRLVPTRDWPLEAAQLLNLSFPDILGNDREPGHEDFWGGELFDRGNPLHYSLYIGFAPLLLILFAFQKPSKKLSRFLIGSIILFFLLSLGHYSVLYPVISKIPLLASIFYPVKFIIGSVFALTLLAALGFDLIFNSGQTQNNKMRGVFIFSAVSFAAFLLFRKEVFHFFTRLFAITTEASARELRQSFWHGMALWMFYAVILFLFSLPKKPLRKIAFVFLAMLMTDLGYHNRHINPVIPTDFFREPVLLSDSAKPIRVHRENALPDGIRPLLKTAEGAARYYRFSLYPFCGIGEGFRYLFNEDRYLFYSSRYHALMQSIAGRGKNELVKILRAQGCEYFVGHNPLPGLSTQTFAVQGHLLYIQKICDGVPPAYVVHHSVEARSREGALDILKEEGFDPRKTAILEEGGPVLTGAIPPDGKTATPAIIMDSSSRKQFSISISHPGLLIIPGNSAPGWKAWVDGRPTAVLEALPASRAVFLPAGQHSVSMKYRPRSFTRGGMVTLFSLVGLCLYLASLLFGGGAKSEHKAG